MTCESCERAYPRVGAVLDFRYRAPGRVGQTRVSSREATRNSLIRLVARRPTWSTGSDRVFA